MSGALKRDEWKTVRLGDVCDDKVEKLSSSSQGEIYYVDIASINNETKEIVSPQRIDSATAPSRAKQILKKNDVLVSTVRPNLNAVAIHEIDYDIPTIASTGFCVLRCHNSLDSHYTFYFCQSDYFIKSLVKVATGASYPAVRNSDVLGVKIPLPPLDIQRRIADTLDKVTELITLRKTQLEKLDELVKARFVEMFGDLASPECKWNREKLVDACVNSDDIKCGPFGTQLSKDEYVDTGVAVWEIPQINSLFVTTPTHYLTEEKARQLEAYSIKSGDIAMSRKGNVGKCAVFPSNFEAGIIHSDVLRIRVDDSRVLPLFMMHQLHYSGAVQHQIELVSSGAIMAGINVTKLKQIFIHIPPMELQNQFVAFVEQTDKSKAIIQQSLDTLETLQKSLMQEYFG